MSDETLTSSPPPSPSADQRTRTIAAVVAVGAAALFLLVAIAVTRSGGEDDAAAETSGEEDSGLSGVAVDPRAYPRPAFTLTDIEGKPYDFMTETQGELTLLFFGYTHCPDICPVQMATLTAALNQPAMPEATVVFVTTDPERDTPDRLREWLGGFDADYVGLSGTPEQIAAAEVAASVPASVIYDDVSGEYEVGHAAQVLAYSPDDQAHAVYPSGVRRQDWMADLPLLAERRG